MAATVLAAQLYTVRQFLQTPTDIARSLSRVRALGYQAVQLSALGPIEPRELRKIADSEGLTICATHVTFEKLRDEPDAVIEEHKTLGCEHVAIGSLPKEYQGSAAGFTRFAREAEAVGQKLAAAGLTFSYHNHSFEFEKYEGRLALDIIFEESDPRYVKAELDTYWIQHGGGDPAAWIKKLAHRLVLLHLKDMTIRNRTQTFAEVGEGNLNWVSIMSAAKAAGVRWYIVEQDTCERDPFESLAISLRNLRNMGLQ